MKLTIMHFGNYRVMSYGNGTAYDVTDEKSGEHFFLQGDDAGQFRDECESRSWPKVCRDYMDAIGNITN